MKYKKNGVIMETNLETGLSTEEAEKRKKQIQKRETNLLQEIKNDRLLQMLMICNILYMIMLIIAIIWKDYFSAVHTIICCLLVSAVILDICSKNKGIHSRDLYYKKISKENIEVIRDGKKQKVKKDDVTIGDIIVLEKGMKTDFSGVIIKGEVYIQSDFMNQKYKREPLKSEREVINIDEGDCLVEESFIWAGEGSVCSGSAYMIVTYLLGEEIF